MRVWKEALHVLAITNMCHDQVCVAGISENGQWRRLQPLFQSDLGSKTERVFKNFGCTDIFLCDTDAQGRRVEDRDIFWEEFHKPVLVGELQEEEQKLFLDEHLDDNVYSIFSSGRTIGLVKAIIQNLEFKWNDYREDFEARIVFKDCTGKSYNFPCTEIFWRNYWVNLVNKNQKELSQRLLTLQWMLNDQDTYLVVGLTEPFPEIPGTFGGRWPMVMGVHSLPKEIYLDDYAHLI